MQKLRIQIAKAGGSELQRSLDLTMGFLSENQNEFIALREPNVVRKALEDGGVFWLLDELNRNRVVGTAVCYRGEAENLIFGEVGTVQIAAILQRMGLSKVMVSHAIAYEAMVNGGPLDRMIARIHDANIKSKLAFTSLGFVPQQMSAEELALFARALRWKRAPSDAAIVYSVSEHTVLRALEFVELHGQKHILKRNVDDEAAVVAVDLDYLKPRHLQDSLRETIIEMRARLSARAKVG